jgi:hypothetical protein
LADDEFSQYVEALNALSSVHNRQRDALRKATEAAGAVQNRARAALADQQRMYDKAGRDAADAERALGELAKVLRVPVPTPGPIPAAGTPRQLVELRSAVGAVAAWATESKTLAESLVRTRTRLEQAPKPIESRSTPAAAPGPLSEAPPVRSAVLPVVIAAVIAAVLIVVILVIVI